MRSEPSAPTTPSAGETPAAAEKCRRIAAALVGAPAVWIAAHERPDGDALGSALGLARILHARGVDARLGGLEPIPPSLRFLIEPSDRFVDAGDMPPDGTVLAMLDCHEIDRLSPCVRSWAEKLSAVAVIDHHQGMTETGPLEWVEPDASSTGELVTRLALGEGWEIGPSAADALWVALATDTGRFCFSNATPTAMRTTAELLARGASPARLSERLWFSPRRAELLLEARALSTLTMQFDGRLVMVRLRASDFAAVGAGPECAQEVCNRIRGTEGAVAAFFLYEPCAGQIKLGVRTVEPYDARRYCAELGGGGHLRAAGCSMSGMSFEDAERKALATAGRLLFPGIRE